MPPVMLHVALLMQTAALSTNLGATPAITTQPAEPETITCDSDEYISWRPSDGCPEPDQHCLSIDATSEEDVALIGVTLPRCDWTDVELRITRSNTVFSCDDQVLASSTKGGKGVGIRIASTVRPRVDRNPVACDEAATAAPMCPDRDGLHDVTVMRCEVRGYEHGIAVSARGNSDAYELITSEYLAWFEHPNEALCRVEQIEDCLRDVAPQRITISDVTVTGPADVGVYVGSYCHDVTIAMSSVTGTGRGPGIYLDAGSRQNHVVGNFIAENGREAVAIDASADNLIESNHIEHNGLRSTETDGRFRVGIAIYKNFWEFRWRAENPQRPRVQRSERNVIDDNDIIDHVYGVHIAMRQDWSRDDGPGSQGAWGDPIYTFDDGLISDSYHYRERAADNVVRQNRFSRHIVAVAVRDDNNQILGNAFTGSYLHDVYIGAETRQWVREPVHGVTVAGNVFSHDGDGHDDYAAVRVSHCSIDTTLWWNVGGPVVTDGCGLTRARAQAITATSSGHTLAFGQRLGHLHPAQDWLVGDFDADGRDDLLERYFTGDGRLRLWMHRTAGSQFEHQTAFQTLEWPGALPKNGQFVVGQFDGTQGDDLAYVYGAGGVSCAHVWISYGLGFRRLTAPLASGSCMTVSYQPYATGQRWLATDFTGDGKDDLVQVRPSGTSVYVEGHRATGPTIFGLFAPVAAFNLPYGVWRAEDQYLAGDFDGDGFGDVARIWRGGGDRAQIWVFYLGANGSTGSRNQDFSTAPGANDGAGFVVGRRWLASDFDGDGRKDIVLVYNRSGDARVWRHRSTGRAFAFVGIQTVGSFVDTQRWLSGRIDGNTRDDLVRVSGHTWP